MFYRCPNCKKIWQYPIEKCPDCFQELEDLPSAKTKVIGISEVNIPTLTHPKTPYFVLVLEDKNNNCWVEKSIKEYKIGEEFFLEPNKNKNSVAIQRIKYDFLEAITKLIKLLGGLNINSDTKILILPTLISPKHPYLAINTNHKFLESLIKYLLKSGASNQNIKVAAQSFDDTPIELSAQKSQLLDVCLKNQIAPLDLAKTNFIKKEKDNLTFEISEEVFNSDLIINLPILKLDKKSGIKGARENSLKFLKKESYLGLKYLTDENELTEKLQEVLPNYLTVADGWVVKKTNGLTTFLGLAMAGFNPKNIDRVFFEIAMSENIPEDLKKISLSEIPVLGREIKSLQYEVEKY